LGGEAIKLSRDIFQGVDNEEAELQSLDNEFIKHFGDVCVEMFVFVEVVSEFYDDLLDDGV
jgi:hypothetical protein